MPCNHHKPGSDHPILSLLRLRELGAIAGPRDDMRDMYYLDSATLLVARSIPLGDEGSSDL